MFDEAKVYQRIGEFVVAFQWLENRIREIGWLILDPGRKLWPLTQLRNDSTAELFRKVTSLFLDALPRCDLDSDVEADLRAKFEQNTKRFRALRLARNKILHSAYVELEGGGILHGILRSNSRIEVDAETGDLLLDQEMLSEESFEFEFKEMAELGSFFNRCYLQLIQRLPGTDSTHRDSL